MIRFDSEKSITCFLLFEWFVIYVLSRKLLKTAKAGIFGDGSVEFEDNLGLSVIDQDEATFNNPSYGTSGPLHFVGEQKQNYSNASLKITDSGSVHSIEL